MAKSSTATSAPQSPTVLIRYEPEKELALLGDDALEIVGKVEKIKFDSPKTLEAGTATMDECREVLERLDEIRARLNDRLQAAIEPLKEFPIFDGVEPIITFKAWPLRKRLETAMENGRQARAAYLDAEAQKERQKQQELEAEQRKKNEAAAKVAVQAAKGQGADPATLKEIKREVLSTQAPLFESKALSTARSTGVGLQYDYYAEVTDLRKLLQLCLNNEIMLNTMQVAVPEIEKAFRKMASDQKERFVYEGIRFKKVPRDVRRGKS
ncbi:MAG TPA: hypothetical protein VND65_01860 [Candidatus Binatia bacterium]|nr:hypothetical protein [Candidatus Binatia bacterium]